MFVSLTSPYRGNQISPSLRNPKSALFNILFHFPFDFKLTFKIRRMRFSNPLGSDLQINAIFPISPPRHPWLSCTRF